MRLPRQEEPVNFLVIRIGSLCEERGDDGGGVSGVGRPERGSLRMPKQTVVSGCWVGDLV